MTREKIKEQLINALKSKKHGHAYLFVGESGAGKFNLALELAYFYLCGGENKPCGECESCRAIKKYTCPYFQYLFPLKLEEKMRKNDDLTQEGWEYIHEKTLFRIKNPQTPISDYFAPIYKDRIRNMNDNILSRRGKKTVTVIDGIDTISEISLNTMLKTLEEPPAGALIILLARFDVLMTIRSRCIVYKFPPPSKQPEYSQETKEMAADFANIVFTEKSDFLRMLSLEKFTSALGRNFDSAQQILIYFLSQIRIGFLYATKFSETKPQINIANFRDYQQASLCCDAVDKSILSIKRSSPLSMVFAELTIKLTEIFNERN
jgi:hypothetical protein